MEEPILLSFDELIGDLNSSEGISEHELQLINHRYPLAPGQGRKCEACNSKHAVYTYVGATFRGRYVVQGPVTTQTCESCGTREQILRIYGSKLGCIFNVG